MMLLFLSKYALFIRKKFHWLLLYGIIVNPNEITRFISRRLHCLSLFQMVNGPHGESGMVAQLLVTVERELECGLVTIQLLPFSAIHV